MILYKHANIVQLIAMSSPGTTYSLEVLFTTWKYNLLLGGI